MTTRIPFILTNEQRKYLGLIPVEDNWELVPFAGYYLYYDGDVIRKKIETKDDGTYYEAEVCEHTEQNRTILLPKTSKGKPKKITHATISSFLPFGVYFNFSADYICIASYTTQTTFYHEDNPDKLSLYEWLNKWIAETTESDRKEIENYKNNMRRKHIKYREGDFFSFKIGRRKWGFGRIVLNIPELRKSASYKARKNYGLEHLLGSSIYIMVYRKISDTPDIDINKLMSYGTLPVQAVMDNHFIMENIKS